MTYLKLQAKKTETDDMTLILPENRFSFFVLCLTSELTGSVNPFFAFLFLF